MNYSKCRAEDCVFLVTPKDEYCPNCGIERPQKRPVNEDLAASFAKPEKAGCMMIISIFVLAIILSLVGASLFGRPGGDPTGLVVVTLILSFAIPIFLFNYLKRRAGLGRQTGNYAGNSLRRSENIINRRLAELAEREKQVEAVRARARFNEGEQWKAVRETLDRALGTIQRHHGRYRCKLMEIRLARWQNKLAPLLYGWEDLTYDGTERRLKAMEATRATGSELRSEITKLGKSLGDAPELKELAARLEETLSSYRKIHEGLVARQAVLALKGVTPLKDAVEPATVPASGRREIEVFNAQVMISDFTDSFAELEAEYARLQSEDEVAERISEILERRS